MLIHCCGESGKVFLATSADRSYQISLRKYISLCNGSVETEWECRDSNWLITNNPTQKKALKQFLLTTSVIFQVYLIVLAAFLFFVFQLQNFSDHWNIVNERHDWIIMRRWLWLCKVIFVLLWKKKIVGIITKWVECVSKATDWRKRR